MGISGSGKTTLATELALRLQLPHVELDSIFHQPGWTPLPDEDFAQEVTARLQSSSWVVDGNYSQISRLVLDQCDTLILLDYSRALVMRRIVPRTVRRGLLRQQLWNGNRESIMNIFKLDPEYNILLWAWTMHGRRHHSNLEYEAEFRAAGRTVHRFASPRQTERWLLSV